MIPPTSKSAPPIAVRPFPISLQDISPNFTNASANLPIPFITIANEPDPNIPEKPAIFPRAPETPATSRSAPPIPTRPLAISFHAIDPNFFIASASSSRP